MKSAVLILKDGSIIKTKDAMITVLLSSLGEVHIRIDAEDYEMITGSEPVEK